jgi:Homeobox KN domain
MRSPPISTRQTTTYAQEPYPSYPPAAYARGTRRPSYTEERRSGRHESLRYPAPVPYGSSYPPSFPYEYVGGRGYYDPYQGYVEYSPDRRLSQQEPGEQVSHLGVPERSYRPQMVGGPTSPSSIRVQPPPLTSSTPGKRRGNLPKESKEKLKQWLSHHVDHPYPTEEEKKELAAEAGMTMGQVF